MFRLPSHLESLVPPPREQVPQTQPWRGRIFALTAQLLDPTALPLPCPHAEIRVTAAETEYDNQQEQWPEHFQLQIVRRRGVLGELHAWLARHPDGPAYRHPRCMLMPDRLATHAATRRNHALFERVARALLADELVAIAPWGPGYDADALQHGGLVLYPTASTRSLLVGIVFLNAAFPDFLHRHADHPVALLAPGPSHPHPHPHPHGGSGGGGAGAGGGGGAGGGILQAPGLPLGAAELGLLPRAHAFQPVLQHPAFDPAPPHISAASRYSSSSGYSGYSAYEDGTRSGRSSG